MSDLAERLGLWEPCQDYICNGRGTWKGAMSGVPCTCCTCGGTGRILSPIAVRAAWALVEDALDYAATYPEALITPWAMGKKQQLEAAGAKRPQEVSDAT